MLEKSINRRNPAIVNAGVRISTNGVGVVIVDYHVDNSKTIRDVVKM